MSHTVGGWDWYSTSVIHSSWMRGYLGRWLDFYMTQMSVRGEIAKRNTAVSMRYSSVQATLYCPVISMQQPP